MRETDKILGLKPFSLDKKSKKIIFMNILNKLLIHHKAHSIIFKKIEKIFSYSPKSLDITKFPFLPVALFKKFELKSVKDNQIYKILKSSGTSSNSPSKIFLDKKTSFYQSKILSSIASNFLGNKRLPMLVVDNIKSSADKNMYSARMAAIYGFSIFAKEIIYLLDENMKIDFNILNKFMKENKSDFFIFGFTSIIWENFCIQLVKNKKKYSFKNAIMLHGGGWKKLLNSGITNNDFKKILNKKFDIKKIVNYYGMVEQTGSIFFECQEGYFHSSIFSDIIIRDKNFQSLNNNNEGIIQLLSLLPWSYPGISIITDDKGTIIGEDNCNCGRLGKYFIVSGRVTNAEIRGCSDVN